MGALSRAGASMRAKRTISDDCQPFAKEFVTQLNFWRWKCLPSIQEPLPCARSAATRYRIHWRIRRVRPRVGAKAKRGAFFAREAAGFRIAAHGDGHERLEKSAVYKLFYVIRDIFGPKCRECARGSRAVARKCDEPALQGGKSPFCRERGI